MTTLPEEAVKTAIAVLYYANPNDVERALTAALPFLSVQGAVKEVPLGAIENGRAFLQRLADHYDFTCEAGTLANCADYHEAVRCFEHIAQWISDLSALEPSPREELMKQIREGTAHGFLNDGSQPEGNPDLDCPYCCGSGHKGDVHPSAVCELALEEALQKEKSLSDRLASALEYIDDYCLSYPDLGTISAVAQPALKAHSDARALSSQPVADHADAGKVEGDGWLPIESAPKDGRVLAVATGEIERISWNDPAAVVTVKAFDGPFVCYVHEDGAGFTDEFGEVYRADGIVIDAEDLTSADNVLRLTYWQPMPGLPSAPASEGAE